MIKVAVLISGRWRQLEETLPKLKRELSNQQIDFRIFASLQRFNPNLGQIHTPSQLGNKYYVGLGKSLYIPYRHNTITDEIARAHFQDEIFQISEIELDKNLKYFISAKSMAKHQTNGLIMYKGMEDVYNLFAKSNSIQNHNFTHFLRIRADYEIAKCSFRDIFLQNDFFFIGETLNFGEYKVNDQCFGGKIEHCEYFMSGYKWISKEIITSRWQSNRDSITIAENVMHGLLREVNLDLKIGYYPKAGRLLRPRVKKNLRPESISFLRLVFNHNAKVFKTQCKKALRWTQMKRDE